MNGASPACKAGSAFASLNKAAPEKGKANKELIEKLQEMLKTQIKILQGKTIGNKTIWIKNYSKQKLSETLKNH